MCSTSWIRRNHELELQETTDRAAGNDGGRFPRLNVVNVTIRKT